MCHWLVSGGQSVSGVLRSRRSGDTSRAATLVPTLRAGATSGLWRAAGRWARRGGSFQTPRLPEMRHAISTATSTNGDRVPGFRRPSLRAQGPPRVNSDRSGNSARADAGTRRASLVCVVRETIRRRALILLLAAVVSANGAAILAAPQAASCAGPEHSCCGATVASCCCTTGPVEPLPSTSPDGRADARPPMHACPTLPAVVAVEARSASCRAFPLPRARSSTPLIVLFSVFLI